MEEKNYEEIYDRIKDTGILKIYELGQNTAAALANTSFEDGNDMISKELLPILGPVMFKGFFLEQTNPEDTEFSVDGISTSFDKMVESGEYQAIINNPYYPLYLQIVNNYVDEVNYHNDKGHQVLTVLSEFTSEMQGFLNNLSQNIDQDMLNQVRTLVGGIIDKVESFTKILELTNNLNK